MSRKLASIQKVLDLQPIEGKDKIELATVLGWKVIVQKGQFKAGDLCIYIETDSVLPQVPAFEFLRSRCFAPKWNGFRIKAMKMAGTYSEGIVFPVNTVEQFDAKGTKYSQLVEGFEVTDLLGIVKYDPEALAEAKMEMVFKSPLHKYIWKIKQFFIKVFKTKKDKFPSHLLSKTDETRIQAIPFVLEEFKNTICYVTEKLDGCSASYLYDKNKFIVCSRNVVKGESSKLYGEIAKKYDLKKKLKSYKDMAIQGEIVGPGVGNGSGVNLYELKEIDFYVYNVINTKVKKCLTLEEMKEVCEALGLKFVPILDENYVLGSENVDGILARSNGCSKLKITEREGIVIRDKDNKKVSIPKVGDSLSFKAVSPDFKLKYDL
jgi:hypothetical protein